MTRVTLLVATLLLVDLGGIAAAADNSEHTSKNAQKLIATLNSVGINDKDVHDFIAETDSHVDHGYLYLDQQKALGGEFSLRYHLSSGPSIRQMELHFAPDDSNIQVNAHTNSIRVSYHIEF